MKKIRIILIMLTAALCSCPCVTELPGPEDTEPEKHSLIHFINCIWQSGAVKLSDKYTDPLAFANYSQNNSGYLKVAAEIDNYLKISLSGSGRTLYFSPAELSDNSILSFISYGDTNRTAALLLNDSISNYSANNVYLRVVNLFPDSANLSVTGENNFPVNMKLSYSEHSKILTAYTGKNGISVLYESGKTAVELKDFNFEAGKFYILIIRRSLSNQGLPELFVTDCGTR